MKRKLLSLILILACLVPTLASCKKMESEKSGVFTANTDPAAMTDPLLGTLTFENPEIDKYIYELSERADFSGQTFTWCGNEGQAPEHEEETGDIRNDALYLRQRQLEETFGLVWNNFWPPDLGTGNQGVYDHVMQDVMAGTGAYDLVYGTTIAIAQPLFLQNALSDLSGYQHVDLTREWWTPNLMDIYAIDGSIYFLNGAIVGSNYEDTYCIAFNKQIQEDYGIGDLYSLVYNNEWTFDKMIEIASVIPENKNSSSVYRFGDPNGIATMYAHGMTLSKFDENGLPYVEPAVPEELFDLAVKFSAIYGDENICATSLGDASRFRESEWCINKYGYEDYNEMFADNQFLFYFLTTGDAAWLRIHEVKFGILPVPKGDASQENYISYTGTWGASNVFVPKSAKNTELSDLMLEAMAALGYKYIKPAYYDKILKSRAMYDYESEGMIDIIFSTKVYDIIDFLAVGGNINMDSDFVRTVRGAIRESSSSFASKYKMQAKIVNNNIKGILDKVERDQKTGR